MIRRCIVQLPEAEHGIMAIKNMHPRLREELVAQECADLSQLVSKATRIEQFILENVFESRLGEED